ncbi:MAG: hypothetical protein CVV06_19750 [Gammaproteobacteria bacterium HGW-Gammaproteobacteria-10]|nr:MAG: hypothetical protein CVV06_19750 [Gammaproteobacteria bacterium HGW-Gammaproteobacteria-10]
MLSQSLNGSIHPAPKFHSPSVMVNSLTIPIALQISAFAYGGAGVFGKGFDRMDAIIEPTRTYSRRPLTGTPTPNF